MLAFSGCILISDGMYMLNSRILICGHWLRSRQINSKPVWPGMFTSKIRMCGCAWGMMLITSAALVTLPTTSYCSCGRSALVTPSEKNGWSSAIRIRKGWLILEYRELDGYLKAFSGVGFCHHPPVYKLKQFFNLNIPKSFIQFIL